MESSNLKWMMFYWGYPMTQRSFPLRSRVVSDGFFFSGSVRPTVARTSPHWPQGAQGVFPACHGNRIGFRPEMNTKSNGFLNGNII